MKDKLTVGTTHDFTPEELGLPKAPKSKTQKFVVTEVSNDSVTINYERPK